MALTPAKLTELNYNPWSVKEKPEELRPGPRLDAIISRHYLGFLVLERTNEETGEVIYASRMPEWWLEELKQHGDAGSPTISIPNYSWLDLEALTDAMMLLDFAADYEINTNFGGSDVTVRTWFRAAPGTKRASQQEKTMGEGHANEHDFPQAVRPMPMRASQILGLAICRAVLAAIGEMPDEDYEFHQNETRRSIIRFLCWRLESPD